MLRWHARIGASAIDRESAAANPFEVVLYGTPLCAGDEQRIHARLIDDAWAVETLRSALVLGLCRGRGQLWLPDAQAQLVSLADGTEVHDGLLRRRRLRVYTRLSREDLMERLLDAFSADRYIDAQVLAQAAATPQRAQARPTSAA